MHPTKPLSRHTLLPALALMCESSLSAHQSLRFPHNSRWDPGVGRGTPHPTCERASERWLGAGAWGHQDFRREEGVAAQGTRVEGLSPPCLALSSGHRGGGGAGR